MSESRDTGKIEGRTRFAPKMDRESEIILLEWLLEVRLPNSYKKFLLEKERGFVNGLPLLGLPISLEPTSSVLGATELLRTTRPDLPKSLVVIRLLDTRALCMDLDSGTAEDAPLVEVNLKGKKSAPTRVHDSFKLYLEEAQEREKNIKKSLQRIEKIWQKEHQKRKSKWPKYDHKYGKSFPRAEEWRAFRSCVHDRVVGLTVLKYDPGINGLEIDVFISSDHPKYEEGTGIRNLTLLVLSEAYRSGGSMRLSFTKNVNNGKIPGELIDLAKSYSIALKADQRQISHDEAVSLYAALVSVPRETQDALTRLKDRGLTLEGFCYLVSSGIWTLEEATWILANAPRPEGILLGEDTPENRIYYSESLNYGRVVLSVQRLKQKVLAELTETNPSKSDEGMHCSAISRDNFWIVRASEEFVLPWLMDESNVIIQPDQPLLVLPRPYPLSLINIKELFESDINLLGGLEGTEGKKCLLVSSEFQTLDDASEISRKIFQDEGIHLLSAPFDCDELNEEVSRRIARARVMRK